jgi:CRP/FNR family transcriptional regulator
MEAPILASVDVFFSKYTKLTYKKGETILRAEDPPSGVMYIKKGFVRQFVISETGEVLVLHVFKPGSFYPMMWVLNNVANKYHYEAVIATEIWRAPKEDVLKFLKDNPDIFIHFTKRLLLGVSGLLERLEHLVLESAYVKTVLLLLYYAKNFGVDQDSRLRMSVPITHKEVASWIGTTRETASLQMELLKKKGLVGYEGRTLIIPNVDKLEQEIGSYSSRMYTINPSHPTASD